GIPYVFVLDGEDRVIAHSFDGEVPGEVLDLIQRQNGKFGIQKTEFTLHGKSLFDIGSPFPDTPGSVHIGMDLSGASQQVGKITLISVETVLAVLLAGTGLLWFLMNRTLRPIRDLAQAARKIASEGDLTQEIHIESHDEVGLMASYFNEML